MLNSLEKRYGFWTAVAMVVGIVIGSGVFFKAEKVIQITDGNIYIGIFSWIASGSIMVICAYAFSILAGRYSKVNGIVDYSEASFGKTYGYIVGWFMSVVYFPSLTAILCWISARYTLTLFGINIGANSTEVYVIGIIYLVLICALNIFAPMLAGKIQVSTTFIKLIPLVLMGVIGIIKGISNGQIVQNFVSVSTDIVTSNSIFGAIVATAFAYEGWIVATTINSELKNSRKDLPKALIVGSIFIVVVYTLYFIGISGPLSVNDFIQGGEDSIKHAFFNILGNFGGSTLFIFVIISCLGTLNGMMLATIRGLYSLSIRGMGPCPKFFSKVSEKTNLPVNSGLFGVIIVFIWILLWYLSNKGFFGLFLDFSELPVISMYALYIPIFLCMSRKLEGLNIFNKYIIPYAAIVCSLFMIYATILSHGIVAVSLYFVLFVFVIVVGLIFKNGSKKESL